MNNTCVPWNFAPTSRLVHKRSGSCHVWIKPHPSWKTSFSPSSEALWSGPRVHLRVWRLTCSKAGFWSWIWGFNLTSVKVWTQFFFPSISQNFQMYYGLYNFTVMDLPFRLFIRDNFWKDWEISFLKEHYTVLALFSAWSLSCLQDVLKHSVGLGLTRQIDLYFRLCLVISRSCFHLIETCRYHSSA